jgi:sugar lactone lactonase YvrE
MIHDDRTCLLGEGPFWHPDRARLYWFDIYARRLMWKGGAIELPWLASAAAVIDADHVLVHSEVGLHRLNLDSGAHEPVARVDADNPVTRSNDGRADLQGGFWISTMGKGAEPGAGAIWRYFRGEVRRLFPAISIPNAICFAPDGTTAYFSDTPTQVIRKVRLDRDGWPVGDPEPHIDLGGTPHWPDGAVVDVDGHLWNAQWGSFRVAVYDPAGRETGAHAFPASQTSCPAFGGPDLTDLYCTSASAGLGQTHLAATPDSGRTFVLPTGRKGQAEHRVVLG